MINVDHGILPACTQEVKDDLGLDNANLGLLGSLVYLGLVIGKYFHFMALKVRCFLFPYLTIAIRSLSLLFVCYVTALLLYYSLFQTNSMFSFYPELVLAFSK